MESIGQMIKEEFCAGNSRPHLMGPPKAASFKGGRGLGAQARQALEPVAVDQDGASNLLEDKDGKRFRDRFFDQLLKDKALALLHAAGGSATITATSALGNDSASSTLLLRERRLN